MEALKYKIIKTENQYWEYCDLLETLLGQQTEDIYDNDQEDQIELLTFLIEKWDEGHNSFNDADPVELLKSLMRENGIKPTELADLLEISKSVISEILNYKKGFSKEMIRKLAERFKVRQEAFNKGYPLKSSKKHKELS